MAGKVKCNTNEDGTGRRHVVRSVALLKVSNADGGVTRAMDRRAKVLEKDVFES